MPDQDNLILNKVIEQLNSLFELSSRIDSELTSLSSHQNKLEVKIDSLSNDYQQLKMEMALLKQVQDLKQYDTKIRSLEEQANEISKNLEEYKSKLNMVSLESERMGGYWGKVFDFVSRIGFLIISTYVLYKLGFSN